ncbi:MAG: carotene hydroxylase [Ignavibacteriae bacterium HGW-Ignavibacteriae-4]|jgi:beta-carotene 3-hydroxylase|nr:MAG: carotene hydroxylase [Ignavibacteriae bacterium HGW-Ignavibacteriae-4]
MEIFISLSLVVATFLFMEFVAWFTHKYIMHGFLWVLHKDHHQKEHGFFEKNDVFFIIFAIPSITLFALGAEYTSYVLFSIGLGILVYGIAYFLVHEVFIHKRLKWFKSTNSRYLSVLRKAHYSHHKHLGKEDGESFGMLIVNSKYFK